MPETRVSLCYDDALIVTSVCVYTAYYYFHMIYNICNNGISQYKVSYCILIVRKPINQSINRDVLLQLHKDIVTIGKKEANKPVSPADNVLH